MLDGEQEGEKKRCSVVPAGDVLLRLTGGYWRRREDKAKRQGTGKKAKKRKAKCIVRFVLRICFNCTLSPYMTIRNKSRV